ncbi:MAG: YIP1 family protein [Acidobacteria bacterium]|nr:YIP1 family protein [Acidobacteriota bacterium]
MNDDQSFPPPPPDPPEPPAPPSPSRYDYDAPPPRPTTELLPWERRQELGFAPALIETIKLLVTSPQQAFARAERTGDYASPILFAVIVGWLGIIVGLVWQMLFGSLNFLSMMGNHEGAGTQLALTGGIVVVYAILAPIFIVIGLFIGAGILHLCLMLVKGLDSSQTGFEGTLRAVAYSGVAQLAQVVPFLGGIIAAVWVIVLYILGFVAVHRTTTQKAVIAVLLPVFFCCLCVILMMVLGVGSALVSSGALNN